MYITIKINGNTRDFTINSRNNEEARRAVLAVNHHVEALQRAKLDATLTVYTGKAYVCEMCSGRSDYGGFCTCMDLEEKFVAEWTAANGWSEAWAMVEARHLDKMAA